MKQSLVARIFVEHADFKNYTYVLYHPDTRDGVIVDPAFEKDKIIDRVDQLNISVRGILITHHHPDHTHLAAELSTLYRTKVCISAHAFAKSDIDRNCDIMQLTDEKIIQLGSIRVAPVFMPGHTPGCTGFLIDDNFFSGDTIFIEGVGMCLDDDADPEALFNSICKVKAMLSSDTLVFPGHKYHFDVGAPFSFVLKKNFYLHFKDLNEFVGFRMRKVQHQLFNFGTSC
jgi:hydroxyacylglutathione hydrolase